MSTPRSADTRVYVANSESQDISVFALHDDGRLESLEVVPIQRPAVKGKSVVLALSPGNRYLYASYGNEGAAPTVVSHRIDPESGTLKAFSSTPLGDSVAYLATDHTGRYLLGASYAGAKVMVHPIEPDGSVGEVQQIVTTEPMAHCILADPGNRHVLHTSLGGDLIYQESFNPTTGLLTPQEPRALHVRKGAGPRFMSFGITAPVVYVLCELDGAILVLPYDAQRGQLAAPIQAASVLPPQFSGKPWAADLHLTPDGRFLFACERTSSILAAFRVEAQTGILTAIGRYETVRQPRAFRIDPAGRFLVASGQLANAVIVYAIDGATGALTAVSQYPVGKNPTWVEIAHLEAVSAQAH
jgi:6-phosphogluconolactonase